MDQVTLTSIDISGRYVPCRTENGDVIIENNMILITDQHDGLIYACEATLENLIQLKVIPMSTATPSSASPVHTSHSELQVIENKENQSNTKSGSKWSKNAVLFLIEQWRKKSSKFANTTIRNEEVWKEIAKELEDSGFKELSWKQAQDKWKNLRKAYMKVKDNMGDKNSGSPKITCKFFNELDDVSRESPSVNPISIASSHKFTNLSSSTNESVSNEDIESDPDDPDLSQQPKKKKTKLQRDTFTWMSILRDDAKAREAAQDERHQQTLNVLNRAVDSYQAVMQKLLDKL